MSSRKSGWDDLSLQLASAVVGIANRERFNFSRMCFKFKVSSTILKRLGQKSFWYIHGFDNTFFMRSLPNLPEQDDVYLNPKVLINMRKNNSRSTFSRNVIALFENMLGFSNGASSSSSSSSSEFDNDSPNGDDRNDEATGDDNVVFKHNDLKTSQGSSPSPTPIQERVHSPRQYEDMPP
ncbi:hypothetical protein L1987_23189 [Smallanthus sonchifolius]|uniref:Uncharacterized protein n=1 Tax=Smallanthus sonchifolius TaxID=185202 RepID=A0ACB9IG90_9ASTR|nr:hypothetical protein L1987_23189 [Smallanthus sonchifolius]